MRKNYTTLWGWLRVIECGTSCSEKLCACLGTTPSKVHCCGLSGHLQLGHIRRVLEKAFCLLLSPVIQLTCSKHTLLCKPKQRVVLGDVIQKIWEVFSHKQISVSVCLFLITVFVFMLMLSAFFLIVIFFNLCSFLVYLMKSIACHKMYVSSSCPFWKLQRCAGALCTLKKLKC